MKPEKHQRFLYVASLLMGVGFLSIGVFSEIIAILLLNKGHLVYTLDDPYIHLALAENIINGHYGVNTSEFSAPASSILWPFIIAPFSAFGYGEYFPLLLNICSAIVTLFVAWKSLDKLSN